MSKQTKKGGKKNRKLGRNAEYCKTYFAAGIGERNKRRKMARHLKRYPENAQSVRDFDRLYGNGAAKVVIANMTQGQRRRAERRQSA